MCDKPQWECLQCARKTDLVSDDNCPTCGAELPLFAEHRKDGWPLCPQCGEDELGSLLVWLTETPPPVQDFIDAGMWCYACGWKHEGKG